MVIHSNFADFVLFLYVHAAHIDNTYDPQEMSAIKGKMQTLFPEGTDVEKKLYQTIRTYNSFDRDKMSELWTDSFQYFNGDESARNEKLFNDVSEIVGADGHIHSLEKDLLMQLKALLN